MKTVPIILGPTGIGKTEISLQIAEDIPLEIISADSRQIYRFLNIGTAKPDPDILKKVKHHFIDHLDPDEYYSAGMFGREARAVINSLFESDKMPLVVGGSGFYIQSLVDGLSEIEVPDQKTRAKLQERLLKTGIKDLYDELTSVDPELAKNLKTSDKQRILRGLEVYYSFNRPLSELQKKKPVPADFRPLLIGLGAQRQLLYERINKRVDKMFASGLIDEVRHLKTLGYTKNQNALNTVGYKEVFDHLNGAIDVETMIDKIKQNSRRYAKRQLTWFKRDKRIIWFNIDEFDRLEDLTPDIKALLSKSIEDGQT